MRSFGFVWIMALISCGSGTHEPMNGLSVERSVSQDTSFSHYINENKYTWLSTPYSDSASIRVRFEVPAGSTRLKCQQNSFGDWLRHLPLLPGCPDVKLYNGEKKGNQSAHESVVNIDVGSFDLQQCADAVMRLRAEYLYSQGRYEEIAFHYTSGHEVKFSDWAKGKRPVVKGAKVTFVDGNPKGTDRKNFSEYLRNVFTYAGSLSLSKELKNADVNEIMPGDVFILGGSPGHAVIVVDVAVNGKGERYFMIAQSYMPAQQIHVLKNPNDPDISPWYSVNDLPASFRTPEWIFQKDQLKRF